MGMRSRKVPYLIGISFVSLLLTLGLAAASPVRAQAVSASKETTDALADAQTRYDDAQSKLDEIGSELEAIGLQEAQTEDDISTNQDSITQAQNAVDTAQDAIASAQSDIDRQQASLSEKQGQLAKRVSAEYKGGSTTMLSVLLASSDFEDFVSNVYYMTEVNRQDQKAVDAVRDLKAQLEQQKTDLEQQKADLEQQKADLEQKQSDLQGLLDQQKQQESDIQSKQQEATDLVNNLDQEVKDLMAKKDAEIEASRQAEIAAAAAAAAGSGSSGDYASTYGSAAAGYGETRQKLVTAALSLLGTPYVWGGTWPSSGGTDCSGLMQWAYSQAGLTIPRTTYGQMPACQAAGHWFHDASQLQPGDLVFLNGGGHVAMYIGNGQCVHDPSPGKVVCIVPLTNWSSYVGFGFPVA